MTPLHHWGDLLRELLLRVPLDAARVLFVLVPLVLLLWVLTLPAARAYPPPPAPRTLGNNLKLWAGLALGIQIFIYLVL